MDFYEINHVLEINHIICFKNQNSTKQKNRAITDPVLSYLRSR